MRPLPFPESATESVIMTLNTKECNTCHEVRTVENFSKNAGKCKPCKAQYQKERSAKIAAENSLLSLEELRAMTPKKKCSKCKETLPSTEFHRNNTTKSGLQNRCHRCDNAERITRRTQYKKQNESLPLTELRQRTPEKKCSRCEETLTSIEFYRDNNAKSGLKDVCLDCSSELCSEWFKNNPEKSRDSCARYRAKKKGLFWEDITLEQILGRDGHACAWCGVVPDSYDVDHVRPLDLNGIHAPFNLVASCPSCNRSKSNLEPAVWLAKRLAEGWWNTPSPSALEAVRLAYSGIHEDLAAQIKLTKQNVALTA